MAPRVFCLLAAFGQANAASTYTVDQFGEAECAGDATATYQENFEQFAERIFAIQIGADQSHANLDCTDGCCAGTHGDQSHSFQEDMECGSIKHYLNVDCVGTPENAGQNPTGISTCSFGYNDGTSARTTSCVCGSDSDCGDIEPDDSFGSTTAPNSVHLAIGFATYFVGVAA